MADLQPWFKLWCSALDDPSLEALSLEDWARWVRLALLVKRHGDGGSIRVQLRSKSLRTTLRLTSNRVQLKEISTVLQRLPGVTLMSDGDDVVITFRNWRKYQCSPSADRTRRWRERKRQEGVTVTSQSTSLQRENGDACDVERRGEEKPPISPTSPEQRATDLPDEAFNVDCPDRRWTYQRQCVNTAWLGAHPDVKHYPASDANGTPKQCPHHRGAFR